MTPKVIYTETLCTISSWAMDPPGPTLEPPMSQTTCSVSLFSSVHILTVGLRGVGLSEVDCTCIQVPTCTCTCITRYHATNMYNSLHSHRIYLSSYTSLAVLIKYARDL